MYNVVVNYTFTASNRLFVARINRMLLNQLEQMDTQFG